MVAFSLWFNSSQKDPPQPPLVKGGLPQFQIYITMWVLFAALFWVVPAIAQVSISPLVIEVQAKRGQAQGVINVGNNTSEGDNQRTKNFNVNLVIPDITRGKQNNNE